MRYLPHCFLASMICLGCFGCVAQPNGQTITARLDDGFWSFYSSDPSVQMSDVWMTEGDVIVCSGQPLGYIYSNETFDNFTLKLQWRWPVEQGPGKGGVLIRTSGPDKIWPRSLEAQLNAPDAGDFWGLDGYEFSGPADRLQSLNHEAFGKLTNLKKLGTPERPAGQWNTYEIIAQGDTVTLVINGTEVNKATGCTVNRGPVCLTAEGSEIHFRDIQITPLAAR